MIRITNRDATPPPEAYIKASSGMLLDMSIHDFNLCRYFAGSEAESVYCTGACNLVPYIGANGDVDTAVTVINFKNGCTAVVEVKTLPALEQSAAWLDRQSSRSSTSSI